MELILADTAETAEEIFGPTDAKKLRSSMTLFHRTAPDDPLFSQVLERSYDGQTDEQLMGRLDHARHESTELTLGASDRRSARGLRGAGCDQRFGGTELADHPALESVSVAEPIREKP